MVRTNVVSASQRLALMTVEISTTHFFEHPPIQPGMKYTHFQTQVGGPTGDPGVAAALRHGIFAGLHGGDDSVFDQVRLGARRDGIFKHREIFAPVSEPEEEDAHGMARVAAHDVHLTVAVPDPAYRDAVPPYAYMPRGDHSNIEIVLADGTTGDADSQAKAKATAMLHSSAQLDALRAELNTLETAMMKTFLIETAISGYNYVQDASLCLPHTWTPTVHRVRLLRRHLGEPAINYLLEDSWLDSKRIRAFLQTPASDSVLPLHDENFDIDNPIRADMKRLFLLYHYENHCARFDSMGGSHRIMPGR